VQSTGTRRGACHSACATKESVMANRDKQRKEPKKPKQPKKPTA